MAAAYGVLKGIWNGSVAFHGPVDANLSLTNRCNLRCFHCYFYSPLLEQPSYRELRLARKKNIEPEKIDNLHQQKNIDADTKHVNQCIDEMILMGTRRFVFSGQGEALLHKEALNFFERVKAQGAYAMVNTNGTRLNRTKLDELVRMEFDELRITTLAGSPETYCDTHSGSRQQDFQQLKASLQYLAQKKQSVGKTKPKVTLISIVFSYNCHDVKNLATFAVEIKSDQVWFRPFDDVYESSFQNLIPDAEQERKVLAEMKGMRSYFKRHGIKNNIDYFIRAFDAKLNTKRLYEKIPCYYGWLASIVEVDGYVYPCCRCYLPLGNIYENSFSDIWNSHKYTEFRKQAKNINKSKNEVRGCDCFRCVHHTANTKMHAIIHPWSLLRYKKHFRDN